MSDAGPLRGLKVIEMAGVGPGPHAALMLADLGAQVVRIERPGMLDDDLMLRGRVRIELDLRDPAAVTRLSSLIDHADVLLEGFRPGVMERRGLGPRVCLERNPRLVFARVTGWGQTGPLAPRAGHDINYIAMTGALHAIGRPEQRPVPPLNLVGDFGGGSMLVIVGILTALREREISGEGQVVDAAMVDGVGQLSQMMWSLKAQQRWTDERGSNVLDGAAPFYDTYVCGDDRYVAVGAIEPQFYARLLEGLGLDEDCLPAQRDPSGWPELRERFAEVFASRTRDEWVKVFDDTDACVTPVLTYTEAAEHEHAVARGGFVRVDGHVQPAPAPRFSRTPGGVAGPAHRSDDLESVADQWASR